MKKKQGRPPSLVKKVMVGGMVPNYKHAMLARQGFTGTQAVEKGVDVLLEFIAFALAKECVLDALADWETQAKEGNLDWQRLALIKKCINHLTVDLGTHKSVAFAILSEEQRKKVDE